MLEIFSKILTYIFVVIIYLFIYVIIRMIFLDIHAMYRKKSGGLAAGIGCCDGQHSERK